MRRPAAPARRVVVAPATGRVLRADVPAGSPVAPGMVVAVVTSGPVVLRLDLPEALAAKVQPARKCRVEGMAERACHADLSRGECGQVRPMSPWPGSMPRLIGRRMPPAGGGHPSRHLVPRALSPRAMGSIMSGAGQGRDREQVPVQTAPAADGRLNLSGVAGDTLVARRAGLRNWAFRAASPAPRSPRR
jgi:hypothetical protein